MKVLLIQIRQNAQVQKEEYLSFLKYSGLQKSELISLNVFNQSLSNIFIDEYDGVFIGGASVANVLDTKEYPFVIEMIDFVKVLVEKNIPTLASCFGFQVAALALGSEVIDDRVNYEMGTIPINLSSQASDDILLCDTPDNFMAVSVHQQKVNDLPNNCIRLCSTDVCLHSFKIVDKNFWAFQFHPEVDKQTLIERLKVYQSKYTNGDDQYKSVIDSAEETPESNIIITKFTQRVLKKQYKK